MALPVEMQKRRRIRESELQLKIREQRQRRARNEQQARLQRQQQQRLQLKNLITRYSNDIKRIQEKQRTSTNPKITGSRGRSIANARIRGRQEAINFLVKRAEAKQFNSNIKEEAEKIRLGTTQQFNRQRIKKAGLTPGSSLKKVTVRKKPMTATPIDIDINVPENALSKKDIMRAFDKEVKTQRNKALKNAGLNIIAQGFTEQQKDKVFKTLNANQERKLFDIDSKKGISKIDKELLKRQVIGIAPPTISNKKIQSYARTITGTISAPSTSYLQQLQDSLSRRLLVLNRKPLKDRTLTDNIDAVFGGVGAVAIGTVRKVPKKTWEFLTSLLRPDEMATGLFNLATNTDTQKAVLQKTQKFGKKLSEGDPDALSELTSELVSLKVGNKVLREAGKVASTTGVVRRIQEARFILKQPKDIRPFVKQILKSARVQEKLTPNNLKGIKKINFNEVTELNKIEASALKKTLKNTDSFIFGSLGSRTISKGKTKIPKDVDIATKDIDKFLKAFLENLPKKTRKQYTIGNEYIKKGNTKILDIKLYSRLRPDQTIFGKGRLPINTIVYKTNKPALKQAGLTIPTQSLVKIEGIKLLSFGEQTTRKALGTLQIILEKGARRAKDAAGFIESLEIQIAALKGRIPKTNIVNKYLLKQKLKDLENAVKILKSKEFQNLLNKKVPGLSKEFPILKKIGKLNKKTLNQRIKNKINKLKDKVTSKAKPKKKPTKKPKKKPSKLPKKKPSKLPSRIPKSRIPKSRIPKAKVSRVPKVSKIPTSKLPKVKVSKLPKVKPSRVPKSRVPTSKLPTTSRLPKAKPSRLPTVKPSKLPIPKTKDKPKAIPSINFDSDTYKNRIVIYDAVFRERKNPKKPTSRLNPIVSKTIRLRETRNRALQRVANKVDRNLARSIKIKVVGVTNKKMKDIPVPSVLRKFNKKKSINTPVLTLVEQSKYLLDRKGEKKQIKKVKKVAKVTKRRPKAPPKPKPRVSKVTKKKKSPQKASKKKNKKKSK